MASSHVYGLRHNLTACTDGRVTLSMVDGQVEIKYQHLNPATYFQEVIETARSVILAGGTMSPVRSRSHLGAPVLTRWSADVGHREPALRERTPRPPSDVLVRPHHP